ncbi:MAG: hypothetical protein ACK4UN_10015, partial [Limisphaerales bacterium]
AVPLLGGTAWENTPHDLASQSQNSTTVKSLRKISYDALRAAGCRKRDATEIVLAAENYSKMMGWAIGP